MKDWVKDVKKASDYVQENVGLMEHQANGIRVKERHEKEDEKDYPN